MNFTIVNKQILADGIKRLDIFAPNITQKVKPGQYVSVCPEEGDERIPLSVVDLDVRKQTIALIFHEVGDTTKKLGGMPINEPVFSILGPLGVPSKIEKRGVVVCVATGLGTAQILPICRALKQCGNKVIGIIGAKTKQALMLEPQIRLACNTVFITTNDGSYERKGLATDFLKDLIEKQNVDLVYAIGSTKMMEDVCSFTKVKKIETRVHLNPVMVDCMGMCGSCRVKVGGKVVLACTEGPEFNGHKVDFDDFKIRINAFKETEECRSRPLSSSPRKNESTILTKFLSGILKN